MKPALLAAGSTCPGLTAGRLQVARLLGRLLAAGLCCVEDMRVAKILLQGTVRDARELEYYQHLWVTAAAGQDLSCHRFMLAYWQVVAPAVEFTTHVRPATCPAADSLQSELALQSRTHQDALHCTVT